jgi:hypothetical protein
MVKDLSLFTTQLKHSFSTIENFINEDVEVFFTYCVFNIFKIQLVVVFRCIVLTVSHLKLR